MRAHRGQRRSKAIALKGFLPSLQARFSSRAQATTPGSRRRRVVRDPAKICPACEFDYFLGSIKPFPSFSSCLFLLIITINTTTIISIMVRLPEGEAEQWVHQWQYQQGRLWRREEAKESPTTSVTVDYIQYEWTMCRFACLSAGILRVRMNMSHENKSGKILVKGKQIKQNIGDLHL